MSNPLTGDFDAVAEISVPTINRVLAAQHQETGPDPEDEIYFHSLSTPVPPTRLGDAAGVRGIAEVQVSTPTITLPAHAGASRVTVHFQTMVRMRAEPESVEVPEFIHGEIQATVDVAQIAAASGDLIAVNLGAADVEITFTPNSGSPLSPAEVDLVRRAIDNYLRTGFEPVNLSVSLPREGEFAIRHWRFKTLSSGAPPAVALLMNLHDAVPTDAHRNRFTRTFLGSGDGFALAIGADFLLPKLRQIIDRELDERVRGLRIDVDLGIFGSTTYTISRLDEPRVELRAGAIRVVVSGRAGNGSWFPPDFDFTLTQDFTLRISGGEPVLDTLGEPRLEVSDLIVGWLTDVILDRLRPQINGILDEARPIIRDMLAGLRRFTDNLRAPTLRLGYRAAEISPDGLIVRGDLRVARWRDVVATFTTKTLTPEPPGRPDPVLELNALESWVPGGAVTRYVWQPTGPCGGAAGAITEEHRFVTRLPPGWGLIAWPPCRFCLVVAGRREGRPVAGISCGIVRTDIPIIPVLPPGGRLRLPLGVWASDGALVAHLDLGNRETTAGATGANLIVHFAGSDPEKSVPVLREALATRGHQDRMALTVAVVAPGKLEQKLAAPDPKDAKRGVHIAWAEDFEAEWAKVFGIQELPATFLVNAEGKMAWKHIGQANADVYRQAFDEHLVASGPPHFRRLGLKVRTGEPVPDFLFEYLEGRQVALRTLRGQPVILTFWTSWSEPSLAELRQLQKVHDQFANQGLVILAINDGENPKHARAAFEKMDLPFAFVPDPDRRISGLFGVNCWPTTVAIAEDGLVQRVQFGVSGSVPDLGQKGVAGDGESTDPLMPANVAGE